MGLNIIPPALTNIGSFQIQLVTGVRLGMEAAVEWGKTLIPQGRRGPLLVPPVSLNGKWSFQNVTCNYVVAVVTSH